MAWSNRYISDTSAGMKYDQLLIAGRSSSRDVDTNAYDASLHHLDHDHHYHYDEKAPAVAPSSAKKWFPEEMAAA